MRMVGGDVGSDRVRLPRWLAILLVSLAGLLLEVGYTRIVSYKLWYYYTYLVIGFALLGIGSGGVFVAISPRLRSWTTERLVAVCSFAGAVSIAVGYFVIARLPVDTVAIWDYGTGASFKNLFLLGIICFALYATFIAFGIIVSVLLGRAGDGVAKLYFSDLIGAGLGCVLAIPLITRLGPPRVVMLAALIFAVVGLISATPKSVIGVLAGVSESCWSSPSARATSFPTSGPRTASSTRRSRWIREWGPVFRVDTVEVNNDSSNYLLLHDGTFGSGIRRCERQHRVARRTTRRIPARSRSTCAARRPRTS